MALLTIPSVVKGTPSSISLDKNALFALTQVSGDAYFSSPQNVKRCLIEYKSSSGGQVKLLVFNLSEENPTAPMLVSSTGRDLFQLSSLVLEDNDGGILVVSGAQLEPQNISLGGSEALSISFIDAVEGEDGSYIINWSTTGDVTGLYVNVDLFENEILQFSQPLQVLASDNTFALPPESVVSGLVLRLRLFNDAEGSVAVDPEVASSTWITEVTNSGGGGGTNPSLTILGVNSTGNDSIRFSYATANVGPYTEIGLYVVNPPNPGETFVTYTLAAPNVGTATEGGGYVDIPSSFFDPSLTYTIGLAAVGQGSTPMLLDFDYPGFVVEDGTGGGGGGGGGGGSGGLFIVTPVATTDLRVSYLFTGDTPSPGALIWLRDVNGVSLQATGFDTDSANQWVGLPENLTTGYVIYLELTDSSGNNVLYTSSLVALN